MAGTTEAHGGEAAAVCPWIVPALSLASFVTMLNAMALGPFLPVIARDLGTSVSLLGQIPALSMLLAALLGLAIGPLADRIGHRRALLGSLVAAIVSSLGIGLAPGYTLLLAAALVGAAGRAITQPLAVVIASSHFHGDRQRRAISWVMAGVTGAVIAGIPVLTITADFLGWRSAFAGLALITFASLLLAERYVSPDDHRKTERLSAREILSAYRPLMRHRPSLGLIGSTLLGAAAVWSMATYLGAFYNDRHGFTIQQIGWVYLVVGGALLLGNLAVGGRLGTLPLRPLAIACRVVTALAIGGLFILPLPALAGIALLVAQGASTGVASIAITLMLTRESPARRATTLTLNTAVLSLGTALGSALGGLLLALGGYGLVGMFAMAFAISSAIMIRASTARVTSEREPTAATAPA
ncbi:MAG TPA: MFS transporter [Thermomicrobiales bacterium]|nr:MFS transporter [Thermomicrobiales bacterium]